MNLKINLLICLSALLAIGGVTRSEDEQADFEDIDGSAGVDSQPNVQVKTEDKKEKVKYVKPVPKGVYHFLETFDIDTIGTKWIKSKAKKDDVDESIAKYEGEWSIESSVDAVFEGDKGLVLKSKAKHHAISSKLIKPFLFSNKNPLIVQYEVKFQSPLECGGAYVKLLSDEPKLSLENFFDKTSFSIMFGPDKCGGESKYHFIVRFKHPVKGTFEEKHAKKSELIDAYFSDGKTHLYTLIVEPDNTFKMLIDMNEVNSGSLLKDLNPPINPQKEIIDPNDKKPENWDDREKIPDPDAVKPEDWDENEPKEIVDENAKMPEGWLETESETISDASAVKPDDWDDTTDGEWEAPKVDNPKCKSAPGCGKWTPPMISNPRYKGKWRAPLIDNSNYQGKWEPRKIPNPDFFENNEPFYSFVPFSAIGLELWSMTENIYFDNFIITDDKSVADQFAKDSWVLKKSLESINSRSSDSVIDGLLNAANEKPWLWALYVLVILLPIIIIAVFCCGKSPSKSAAKTDAKKTDAPTQDDATEEQEVNEDEEEEQLVDDAEEPKEEETKASLEPTEDDAGSDSKLEESKKAKSSPVKRRSARKD